MYKYKFQSPKIKKKIRNDAEMINKNLKQI